MVELTKLPARPAGIAARQVRIGFTVAGLGFMR
jgi:hypothetical protein